MRSCADGDGWVAGVELAIGEPFDEAVSPVNVRRIADEDVGSPVRLDFASVYVAQRDGMVRLAFVIAGSNEIAEEVTQEAFARLHQRWSSVDNPVAYLRTIVTNLCRSELRRFALERRTKPEPLPDIGVPEIDETWKVVCRLPFRQRAVLALRYYADLPEAEVARILGCRIGTVKSAHHRALVRLREELS
jgi:RNA polymerase sigma-70 factor (sigma-E family)